MVANFLGIKCITVSIFFKQFNYNLKVLCLVLFIDLPLI